MARRIRLTSSSMQQKTALFQLRDPDDESIVTNDYAWGSWEPIDIPVDDSDLSYVVKTPDLGHFDNLAKKFYGVEDLFWVILHVNDILDQFTDDVDKGGVAIGTTLRIPTRDRLVSILSRAQTAAITGEVAKALTLPRVVGDNPLGL
jgi:hypothetical protein